MGVFVGGGGRGPLSLVPGAHVMVAFCASISRHERWPSLAMSAHARSAASLECAWPSAMVNKASRRKYCSSPNHGEDSRIFDFQREKCKKLVRFALFLNTTL